MDRVALSVLLGLILSGCGTAFSSAEASSVESAAAESTSEPTPHPTHAPTPEPTETPTPEPTVEADLALACDAIEEFRESGPLITRLTEAAFESFETGDYDGWEDAANRMNEQFQDVITKLDRVPNVPPYAEWKRHTLEIMLSIASAIVEYDQGVQNLDIAGMEAGNEALATGTDSIEPMNTAAAVFESNCR